MKSLITIICFFVLSALLAQPSASIHPLQIGEKVPDYQLTKLINYPSSTAKVSDFKGRLLIFDFWSTGCAGCIQSFPKLLSLQHKYKDRIAIIMVNSTQDESIVRKVYERQKKLRNITMTLPSVCGDSLLQKFFPHESVPHTVWIDDQGVLLYITYSQSLTENNIQAVLNKNQVYMKHKGGKQTWSIRQPLFTETNGGMPKDTLWQSSLLRVSENVNPGYNITSSDKMNCYKIAAVNQCILDLYRLAYSREVTSWGGVEPTLMSKVELDVKDRSPLIGNYYDVNDEKVSERLYTYSLIAPAQSRESLQRIMQNDLDRFFGFRASWEKKEKTCLVLGASDTTKISYRSGPQNKSLAPFIVDINDVPVSFFLESLTYRTSFLDSPYPLLDETGLKGNLGHISFETDMNNLDALNQQLSKYGLKFYLTPRMVDVLVIRNRATETGSY